MTALVTAATGLVGANIARELVAAGYRVRALLRATSDLRALRGVSVEMVEGDVQDAGSLRAACRGCNLLFHAAAVLAYTGHPPEDLQVVAVEGARNAVDAAASAGIQRVVLTASSVVLGSSTRPDVRDERSPFEEDDPPPYCLAKVAQEQAAFERANHAGIELISVCPTITVGPHDYRLSPSNATVVSYPADPFRATFSGGCNVVDVRDVARGHRLAAEQGELGERYPLGSENREWREIHRVISELSGVNGLRAYANHTGSYLAAVATEAMAWLGDSRPLTTRVQARTVGRYYWYATDRAWALAYSARSGRAALAAAIGWMTLTPHVTNAVRRSLFLAPEVFRAREAPWLEAALRRKTSSQIQALLGRPQYR